VDNPGGVCASGLYPGGVCASGLYPGVVSSSVNPGAVSGSVNPGGGYPAVSLGWWVSRCIPRVVGVPGMLPMVGVPGMLPMVGVPGMLPMVGIWWVYTPPGMLLGEYGGYTPLLVCLPPCIPGYTMVYTLHPVLHILPLMVYRCTVTRLWAQRRRFPLGESLFLS